MTTARKTTARKTTARKTTTARPTNQRATTEQMSFVPTSEESTQLRQDLRVSGIAKIYKNEYGHSLQIRTKRDGEYLSKFINVLFRKGEEPQIEGYGFIEVVDSFLMVTDSKRTSELYYNLMVLEWNEVDDI